MFTGLVLLYLGIASGRKKQVSTGPEPFQKQDRFLLVRRGSFYDGGFQYRPLNTRMRSMGTPPGPEGIRMLCKSGSASTKGIWV